MSEETIKGKFVSEIKTVVAERVVDECMKDAIAEDVWSCPRCGKDVLRSKISIHAVNDISQPWNTGFEFCGGCPYCDAERRK